MHMKKILGLLAAAIFAVGLYVAPDVQSQPFYRSQTANIVGGTINAASIGATTPSTGAFTTVTTTGKATTYNNVATAGIGVVPVWGVSSLTGQVAAITATTLKATGTSPGAGQYRIAAYVASTVVCATPGTAAVGITLTYTDDIGTKTAQTLPLVVNGGVTLATTVGLGNTTNSAYGEANFFAAATTNIQFATTYVACTAGTGTYSIRVALEQLQ